jgi:peptide deformylase
MAELSIITYPNPILLKKTQKIKDVTKPEIKALIFDMLETMEKNNGLGLAAPQVGKSIRLCVIKLDGKTHVLINPEIVSKSWRKSLAEEGCLSFPGQYISVKRSRSVKVKAQTRKGELVSISADGMLSRALQHEIDHLDGVLFIDKKARPARKK